MLEIADQRRTYGGLVTNVCMAPVEAIPAEAFTSG
jgi:hypothetical protein